ncbi:hypothetical protein C0991_008052, partial [Blastosporella zonata]
QSFYVIKTIDAVERNLKNPPLRDTVDTGADGDTTIIRFVTDNPGPWFFHCHIDWHLDLGFAVVFAVDPKLTAEVQSNQLSNSQQEVTPAEVEVEAAPVAKAEPAVEKPAAEEITAPESETVLAEETPAPVAEALVEEVAQPAVEAETSPVVQKASPVIEEHSAAEPSIHQP